MRLTLRALRSLINEAIGDRSHPDDKAHLICWTLVHGGRPMSRPEVMQKVEELEGKEASKFNPKSGNDYWAPKWVDRADYGRDENGARTVSNQRMEPSDRRGASQWSVLRRDLVKLVSKRRNEFLYAVTPAGAKFAEETDAWIRSRPDLFAEIVPELFT